MYFIIQYIKGFMSMDLQLCTFCLPMWLLASAPKGNLILTLLEMLQTILKKS